MPTRKTTTAKSTKTTKSSAKTKTSRARVSSTPKTTEVTPMPLVDTTFETSTLSSNKRLRLKVKRSRIIIALIVIAIIGLAVYYRSLFVVAIVNGQPITRLSYIQEAESVYIPDARVTAGKQAMNQLVTKALLYQEANRRHITVSDKEVNDEVDQTRKSLEKSGQTLESALALQGDTLAAYKDRIKIQKILDKLVGPITVTDKEITDYIAKNKDSLPQDLSASDMKSQVKSTLTQQKYNDKVQSLIQGLQQKAKINYLIAQ
ncbi:MAG TPA: SurA N-terminal domain-containing protein [Patescibacteria group bacterium]|nr:SurA N-terminal domain-containing protein [Patescibacteria group bacterium]